MDIIKLNKNALTGFNSILSMSNELQQVQDADWFDTPEKRMQWWIDLESQWKRAFCEAVFFNQIGPNTLPNDDNLIHIFEITDLSLCGDWKSNARRNNNADIDFSLTNLSGVKNLTNLTRLEVDYNGHIESIEPVRHLKNLQDFWFDNNKVVDLSPLMGMTSITSLSIWNNKITNIEALTTLPNLNSLTISLYGAGNPIQDYEPLKDILHLKWLYVQEDKLSQALKNKLTNVRVMDY